MRGQQRNAVLAGGRLTAAEADALEVAVAASPGDVMSRLRLLGYYFGKRPRDDRRAAHVLWFITTAPELEVMGEPFVDMDNDDPQYPTACGAWSRVLENPSVPPRALLHAAHFFMRADPARGTELLMRGEREAPTWPNWAMQLGENALGPVAVAHMLAARGIPAKHTHDELVALAKEALGHFERALALAPSAHWQFAILPNCAKAALACGQLADAIRHADATIVVAPDCHDERHLPDRLHDAHIVRGHVALTTGDPDGAKRELEAAGAQGSAHAPVLRSFGPDVRLAQRLLDAGEVEAVVVYLERCATFWNPRRVQRWLDALARGERPRMFTGYDPADRA